MLLRIEKIPKVSAVSPKPPTLVLVVEDDPQLRELYRFALRAAGYAVVAVEDGLDALEFAEQTTPAAVVLDLGLPRVGGHDVQQEFAAHPATQGIPIILVTGELGTIDDRAYACVLRKPIVPDELVTAVHNCLMKHRNG